MAPPRDVIRETREFEAMRDALRRATSAEGEVTPATPKASRGRRRPKHRRR